MTADAQGFIIGADGKEGWAQPYQELIWEIPAKKVANGSPQKEEPPEEQKPRLNPLKAQL